MYMSSPPNNSFGVSGFNTKLVMSSPKMLGKMVEVERLFPRLTKAARYSRTKVLP